MKRLATVSLLALAPALGCDADPGELNLESPDGKLDRPPATHCWEVPLEKDNAKCDGVTFHESIYVAPLADIVLNLTPGATVSQAQAACGAYATANLDLEAGSEAPSGGTCPPKTHGCQVENVASNYYSVQWSPEGWLCGGEPANILYVYYQCGRCVQDACVEEDTGGAP